MSKDRKYRIHDIDEPTRSTTVSAPTPAEAARKVARTGMTGTLCVRDVAAGTEKTFEADQSVWVAEVVL